MRKCVQYMKHQIISLTCCGKDTVLRKKTMLFQNIRKWQAVAMFFVKADYTNDK